MPNQIYRKKNLIIKDARNQYVVENVDSFFEGNKEHRHSHFYYSKGNKSRILDKCKRLIYHVLRRDIPRDCSLRFLGSLVRVTDNEVYRDKVRAIKKSRERKGKKPDYINVNKGARIRKQR